MVSLGAISLLVEDPSVLAALEFSLSVEGFEIRQVPGENIQANACGALVIDERYLGDGVLSVERHLPLSLLPIRQFSFANALWQLTRSSSKNR